MKSLKKILSIFAAFMMVVGLTMTNASAAEGDTGTIQVTDPKKDSYSVYQLFTATTATDNDTNLNGISYVANEDQFNFFDGTNSELFTFTKNLKGTWNVEKKSDVGAQDIIAFIATKTKSDGTLQGLTPLYTLNQENSFTQNDAALGYYFITSGTGSVGMLDTAGKKLIVEDKNDIGFKKTSEGSQVVTDKKVGDLVDFTIEFNAYEGWENVVVSDNPTAGLSIVKDANGKANVTISTTGTLPSYEVSVVTTDEEAHTDSFNIQFGKFEGNQKVTIKYQARVTEHAIFEPNETDVTKNSATLVGDNLPTIKPSEVKVEVYDFDLVKTDKQNKVLSNAQFTLYEAKKNVDGTLVNDSEGKPIADTEKPVQFVVSGNTYKVASQAQKDDKSVTKTTTITAGNVTIQGLGKGKYLLREDKAPDGYNALDKDVVIDINGDNYATVTDDVWTSGGIKVENSTGTELPSTGGMGTTMIYIAGAILMVGAAIIFVTNKRMKHE